MAMRVNYVSDVKIVRSLVLVFVRWMRSLIISASAVTRLEARAAIILRLNWRKVWEQIVLIHKSLPLWWLDFQGGRQCPFVSSGDVRLPPRVFSWYVESIFLYMAEVALPANAEFFKLRRTDGRSDF